MRNIPEDSKIVVAMSGGVDSGTAAYLLVEAGYEVVGVFMQHLDNMDEQRESAQATAKKLDIPLEVVDYRVEFRKVVVNYFISEYKLGRTPNPCVVCNKWIKFGKLLEHSKKRGCQYLATGHYARIKSSLEGKQGSNRFNLLMARDKSKDQSYFLWQLDQNQFEQVLFPIGDRKKEGIVKIAREKHLPVAKRPESFEVCFVGGSLRSFLERYIPSKIEPGPVKDTHGEIIGKHYGLPFYTYGQRRGYDLTKYQGIPLYVIEKDYESNALIVGRGAESEVNEFKLEDVNWIIPPEGNKLNCMIRIRHQGQLIPGTIVIQSRFKPKVVLDYGERGVAPGQSAVFYNGEAVLGGGVISLRS
ncbi:MAG: tRNA 2-thiouridine(34) synthase MnmA [Patescibacteria group bacterium]|nr:tRNA 2-thiouridine(34) synthase MnmA [Patescibacteria group bacterium]